MSVVGVQGEERHDFTKEESRQIRRRSLRLLGSLLKPLRWQVAWTALVVTVSTGAQVAGPALIGYGVAEGLPALLDQDWLPLAWAGAAYLATAVVGALLVAVYIRQSARISQAILIDLRKRVFLHTQKLSLEFHESYTSGRIISRQTSDLDAIRELLDSGINQLVQGVLYMTFTAIALVALDWQSGLVLAVALVPLFVLTRWFQQRSQVLFRRSREASAKLIVHFVETMTGIRAVKAFRKEKRNEKEFGDLVEDYRDVNAKVIQVFGVYDPGLVFIGNVTVAMVLLWGGFRVVDGSLAIGFLLAAVLYTRRFFDPMEDMAMFYNSYQSAASALEKISGVLEERPSVPDPVRPVDLWSARGDIAFDDVEFAYTDDRVVLPAFDLAIPAGQTIALVGSTGAGKSTLAKLISRFYDPSRGAVRLDGVDLRDLHPKDLRRAIVMVTQEAYLFSGSVADNIALGKPDASFDEIVAAARAVGAHEFIEGLPNGYDTDVNKRGGRVSAGQRQLISFARAFLADPAVLILDEATSSLDIPSERAVQEGLTTLLADRTAVIIAHRLSTVAIADRVLVMEWGRIVEDGSPAELIGGEGRFARLHAAWRDSLV
ncbi:ABC transporter [Agromyces rhizosphaerae]|uniref:ABC transporter n=1 Tax=Agromyces rhizosphaerae TaxID=88374 RepID=A0A9W6CWG4_9MICO|nr:ABC transporter ATP-binding protein [Agromyces rhizosphaerae]GLI28054.1 ABC transporter [Agromyces rhizosphaerae]